MGERCGNQAKQAKMKHKLLLEKNMEKFLNRNTLFMMNAVKDRFLPK